ncbi:uncharacterized protein [Centruroides vittatus]|uniref:uncharacterized protein n=1 Tax=Centruroides vittatus TaxID=120091 RepID=UPI00350F2DCA
MGSPMSGLICELVISKLEKDILRDFTEDIIFYKRYVDDVFIIWKDNRRIEQFLIAINSNDHGLKLEQKNHTHLHFLDIDIKFKQGNVQTVVYLKPTHAPLYIPSWSNYPYKYKLSAFKSLIKRAFLYCTNVQDRLTEIGRIKRTTTNSGYKTATIEGLVKSYRQHKGKKDTKVDAINKFTYNKHIEGVMNELSTYKNTKMVYKRAPNIYSLLRNDKDRVKM